MKMFNLIDDCLLCILTRLSLSDLLRIKLVCHRWKSLARQAAARKRCIKLRYTGDDIYEVQHEQYDDLYFSREHYYERASYEELVVGDLTHNNQHIRLELLVRTFTNITSFEFRQINPQAVNRLMDLLHSWPKLTTLKLFVGNAPFPSVTTSREWNCWLEHISTKLTSLRHLVFCESAEHVYCRIRLPVNFCAQLESLHVGLLFEESNIAMRQIVELKNLRTFGFIPFHSRNNQRFDEVKIQYKRVLLTKFLSQLTELMLTADFDCHTREWAIQSTFYRNYQALTNLSLQISKPLHWLMLDSGLHNLANLTYLHVQNNFVDQSTINNPLVRRLWNPQPEPNPCYTSLRTLHLAHVPCFEFHWTVTVLPNLETLQMDKNIRNWTNSTHSTGFNTFCSLMMIIREKGLQKLRQVIYLGQVYPTQPQLKLYYLLPQRYY